jgi:hypothetical protein
LKLCRKHEVYKNKKPLKIKRFTTVCNDASFYGIETNTQLGKIDSTKTKNEKILYLNPKELQAVEQVGLLNDALKNAR